MLMRVSVDPLEVWPKSHSAPKKWDATHTKGIVFAISSLKSGKKDLVVGCLYAVEFPK
jgi:hypothetical protein